MYKRSLLLHTVQQGEMSNQGKISFQVPFNLADPQEKEGVMYKRGTHDNMTFWIIYSLVFVAWRRQKAREQGTGYFSNHLNCSSSALPHRFPWCIVLEYYVKYCFHC